MTFPRTFVINLLTRTDRLEDILKSFSEWPVPIERFEAHRAQPGWKGCLRSHKSLLQRCVSEGCDYAIILEDDCSLTQKGQESFMQLLPLLKQRRNEWDVFMGGVTNISDEVVKGKEPPLFEVRCQTSHFCFFNSQGMQKVVSNLSEEEVYDIFLKKHLRIWCTVPHIAIQKRSHSDIEEKYVDYENCFHVSHEALEKSLRAYRSTSPFSRSSIQILLAIVMFSILISCVWRMRRIVVYS